MSDVIYIFFEYLKFRARNFRFCSQPRMKKRDSISFARVGFCVVSLGPNRPPEPKHTHPRRPYCFSPAPLLFFPAPLLFFPVLSRLGLPYAYKFHLGLQIWGVHACHVNMSTCRDVKMSTCQDVRMSGCVHVNMSRCQMYTPGPLLFFPRAPTVFSLGPYCFFPDFPDFWRAGRPHAYKLNFSLQLQF